MSMKLKIIAMAVLGTFISGCTVQEPVAQEDLTLEKKEDTQPYEEIVKEKEQKPSLEEAPAKIIEEESSIPTVEEEDVTEDFEDEAPEEDLSIDNGAQDEKTEKTAELSAIPAAQLSENNVTDLPVQERQEMLDEAVDDNSSMEALKAEAPEVEFLPYIEHIGVLKIKISQKELRIMIKDPINKHFYLSDPDRIVIDFKPIRYFEPKSVMVDSPSVSAIATATHDKYNRVVIYLNKKSGYVISKDHGDWLIDLKKE